MIMGLCSHQMKRIYLQPVMLVLSLLGDYGNKCDYRLTFRVCVIFPPLLDLSILVTLTPQANIIFSFLSLYEKLLFQPTWLYAILPPYQ